MAPASWAACWTVGATDDEFAVARGGVLLRVEGIAISGVIMITGAGLMGGGDGCAVAGVGPPAGGGALITRTVLPKVTLLFVVLRAVAAPRVVASP